MRSLRKIKPVLKIVEKNGMIHILKSPSSYKFGDLIVYVDKEESTIFHKDQIDHTEWVPGWHTVIVRDLFI